MSKALRVLLVVGAFLALDAVMPRPSWAPAPLLTRAAVLTALRLPGTAEPKAKHAPPPEQLADELQPSEDDAAAVTAAVMPAWNPPATPEATPDAGAPAPVAEQESESKEPAEPVKEAHRAKVPTKPFLAPADAGWDDFRARLAELEAGKRTKVRVVHLGDSEIAGDDVTRTLRRQFRQRYGDGGLGFVLAFKPWNWYAREGYEIRSPGPFSVHGFVQGKASDGDYGPGGIAFDVAKEGAVASLGLSDPPEGGCEVSFHYEEAPGGGALELTADDTVIDKIVTAADSRLPTVKRYKLKDCPSELKARTLSSDKVRIFGWSVESNHPGIVWSSLGVISAQSAHLQHYAQGQLAAALKTLEPDLVVLGYGLNLVHVPTAPPRSERTTYEQVLASLRSEIPDAHCLAVSPYPVAVSEDGTLEPSPSVGVLTRYQREAAAEAGCAFLDRETLSGGPAMALKWLEAKPRILSGDYVHLTTIGAEKMGREMARVLLDEKPEAL